MAYKISGGYFFALLSEIKYTDELISRRQNGQTSPCNNVQLFDDLCGVIDVEYKEKSVPGKTVTNYRTCKEGQGGKGLDTSECVKYFNCGIKEHYATLEKRAKKLFQEDILNNEKKRTLFVNRVLFYLNEASNIKDTALFYYGENNQITKSELLALQEIDLIKFFLGVWHFLITKIKDNRVARQLFLDTFIRSKKNQNALIFNKELDNKIIEKYNVKLINWESELEPIQIDETHFLIDTEPEEVSPGISQPSYTQPSGHTSITIQNVNIHDHGVFNANVEKQIIINGAKKDEEE